LNEEPLFEVISEEEANAPDTSKPKTTRKKKGANTDDRTQTGWYNLPHTVHGFCTVPRHEEVQRELNPEQLEYRDKYPTRMLFEIGEYLVCKDCYLASADLD
jgi:hypothetical protein